MIYCEFCTATTQVVTYLATDSKFLDDVHRAYNYNYTNDLLQEIYEYLLLQDEKFVLKLNSDGQLLFFVFGYINNCLKSNRSDFYFDYKYINDKSDKNIDRSSIPEENEDLSENDDNIQKIISILNEKNFGHYKKELFLRYVRTGKTLHQIAAELDINYNSVWYAVDTAKKIIRKKLKQWNQ